MAWVARSEWVDFYIERWMTRFRIWWLGVKIWWIAAGR